MSKSEVSPFAFDIISKLPSLASRLEKYNRENDMYTLRCDALEEEIMSIREKIEKERIAQAEMQAQLAAIEAQQAKASKPVGTSWKEQEVALLLFNAQEECADDGWSKEQLFKQNARGLLDNEGAAYWADI